MTEIRKKTLRANRRTLRNRSRLTTGETRVRISAFRSHRHIYAQVIDDIAQKTIASCSSLVIKDLTGDKSAVARAVGLELARRAKEVGVGSVVFDRGSCLYHGRIKELAEGLREGGLNF